MQTIIIHTKPSVQVHMEIFLQMEEVTVLCRDKGMFVKQ